MDVSVWRGWSVRVCVCVCVDGYVCVSGVGVLWRGCESMCVCERCEWVCV